GANLTLTSRLSARTYNGAHQDRSRVDSGGCLRREKFLLHPLSDAPPFPTPLEYTTDFPLCFNRLPSVSSPRIRCQGLPSSPPSLPPSSPRQEYGSLPYPSPSPFRTTTTSTMHLYALPFYASPLFRMIKAFE
ncbi:hypothetical protein PENTCL1PPCAC_18415, partial [Pristionchus entomophagus]